MPVRRTAALESAISIPVMVLSFDVLFVISGEKHRKSAAAVPLLRRADVVRNAESALSFVSYSQTQSMGLSLASLMVYRSAFDDRSLQTVNSL